MVKSSMSGIRFPLESKRVGERGLIFLLLMKGLGFIPSLEYSYTHMQTSSSMGQRGTYSWEVQPQQLPYNEMQI